MFDPRTRCQKARLHEYEAKRVTHRVEENTERFAWLKFRLSSAERERELFGAIKIVNRKFQMQLLGYGALRPRGCHVRRYLLKGNCWFTFIKQLDPRHVLGSKAIKRLNL
jgi:hypothetical protein